MTDRDAQGQWRVVRGGTIIHRENKILDFQWLGLNGDIVYARAVDSAGNAGDWESYTYTVTANTAADFVAYVDTSGNDTTGDGSEENPWATVTKAVTEAQSALTSGQVGVIFLSDDQTWAHTATLYSGGDATSRLVRFVRKGGGTNRPLLTFSSGQTGFRCGKRGALHLEGIRVHGNHSGSPYGEAISLNRSGGVAADRDPYNLMVVDCEFDEWWQDIHGTDSVGFADRDTGCLDFLALQGVTFTNAKEYHVYGWDYCQRVLVSGCWFGPSDIDGSAYVNPFRVFGLGRSLFADNVFQTGDNGSLRLLVGSTGAGAAMRFVNVVRHRHVNGATANINIGPNPGTAGAVYVQDVRFVDCRWEAGTGVNIRADDVASNGVYTERIDLLECSAHNALFLTVGGSASTTHVHSSIRIRGCASSDGYGGGPCIRINGSSARYATGCFEIHACGHIWDTANNPQPRVFIEAGGMTRADLIARISACDYNHIAKADADTTDWAQGSNGLVNLTTWRTESGFDANSSVNLNSTLNVTNTGVSVPADGDFRLASDSGPLAGTGYPLPLGVSIDADGYLRSATTPDAGPYEYGASTLPDDPPLPAPSNASRMRRHGLVLGLRLRP